MVHGVNRLGAQVQGTHGGQGRALELGAVGDGGVEQPQQQREAVGRSERAAFTIAVTPPPPGPSQKLNATRLPSGEKNGPPS